MMQAEAQGWADAFNKRRPPKEVQFLTGATALYSLQLQQKFH
jgi:hypothetical protein